MTVWSSLALSDILLLGNMGIQSKNQWFLKISDFALLFCKKESQERLGEVIWLGSSIGTDNDKSGTEIGYALSFMSAFR